MEEIGKLWNDHVLPHWPFLCWMLVAMVIGQVAVRNVFTKVRTARGWAWAWGRRTLPLHPVLAGAVLGLIWRDPEGGGMGPAASACYFAAAGALSLWLFEAVSRFAKARGVEITFPGSDEDHLPPPPPAPLAKP